MRIYAFAALLAFSVVGLAAEAAKADYLCCEADGYEREEFVTRSYHVIKKATVFGCDGYHCETNISVDYGLDIKARCRNGWCELRSIPMKNVWVLESCLEKIGHSALYSKRRYDEPVDDDKFDYPRDGYYRR